MIAFRTLVWALNLGGAALLWAAAENAPTTRPQQIRLACIAVVMVVTLAYVCLLEASQKRAAPDEAKAYRRKAQKSA